MPAVLAATASVLVEDDCVDEFALKICMHACMLACTPKPGTSSSHVAVTGVTSLHANVVGQYGFSSFKLHRSCFCTSNCHLQ